VFNRLFVRSDALNRQLSAPLADERRHYLANCEEQGMSRKTLRSKARILISIANHLKSAYRPPEQITLHQIGQAACRWARKKRSSPSKRLGEEFVSEAVAWLGFLGRLQTQAK
jgi:integrase/recombinase XerD